MKNTTKKYVIKYFGQIWRIAKCGIIISFFFMLLKSFLDVLLPKFIQGIIDIGIMKKDIAIIEKLSIGYLILIVIIYSIDLGLNNFNKNLNLKASSKIKLDFAKHLTRANGESISNQNTGDIIRMLDNDVYQLESFGLDLIFELILNIAIAIVAFFVMLKISPILLGIIIIIQLLLFLFQFMFSKCVTNNIKKVRIIAGEQSILQEQLISNLKNIILTNIANYFLNIYKELQEKLVRQSNKVNFLITVHGKISATFRSFSMILTYLVGGILIVQEKMSMGELIAFSQYCILFVAPFAYFVNYNIKFKQSAIALEKIYDEMDRIIEIKKNQEGSECKEVISKITFHNVQFAYNDKVVLNDFNFIFKKNEITVVTGQSGSGKSTLLNLLYQLWIPQKGKIIINNQPITEYSLDCLKERICIVCQDSLIFNKNIDENICLSDFNITNEKIKKVYQAVDMNQIIMSGVETQTLLGESGSKLSGGQKQRIVLARALVRNCDVFIFDECTSALDNISQYNIMENMRPYLKEKIVIIIAHRLPIAKIADQVIVMDKGKIVEAGTYEELINQKGMFYSMNNLSK